MKRLKLHCLFGGSILPLLAAAFVLIALDYASSQIPLLQIPALLLPVGILIFSYRLVHRMNEEERIRAARSSFPLWEPVTPEVKKMVCNHYEQSQLLGVIPLLLISAAAGAFVFVTDLSPKRYGLIRIPPTSPEVAVKDAFVTGLILFLLLMLRKSLGARWSDIDDSAVFTRLPIDHIKETAQSGYDTKKTKRCLVFYLPDGKYILKIPKHCRECNAVIIVRSGCFLTYVPYYDNSYPSLRSSAQ